MSNIRPRLTVLNAEERERVHFWSLRILSQTGVRVDSTEARELFARAIGTSPDEPIVRIPPELVAWALSTAPSSVDLYNRRGEFAFRLGGGSEGGAPRNGAGTSRFGIGVTNLYYQEPHTDAIVPFRRAHMGISARLGQALSSMDVVSTVGILTDRPPDLADLEGTLEMVANTTKPLVILVSHEPAFARVLDLLEHLCGPLTPRPFVMPYFNPITPLVLNSRTSDGMLDAIERGLPVIFSSYGMAGATTPVTPAGTLALLNAELLAGLVLSQLMREGAAVILGCLPAGFDMRALIGYYGPQTILLNAACAEMMAGYGLPHCGTSGSGAGWGPDLLASDLLWMNHLTACLGQSGLLPFAGGNFDSLAFSPATAVYADHVIRQARTLALGFSLDDRSAGLDQIAEIGPGGNFLTADLTLRYTREARAGSANPRAAIFPRLTLEQWQERNGPRAGDLLRAHTVELLEHAMPPPDHDELIARGEIFLRGMAPT